MLDGRENHNSKSWTEPKPYMVLGLELTGKPSTEKNSSLGQNLSLAWSSDSSLRGNQAHKIKSTSPKQNPGFAKSSGSSFLGKSTARMKKFLGSNTGKG